MILTSKEEKRLIRQVVLQRRDAISEDLRREKNETILKDIKTFAPYIYAQTVMLFASFGSEVDTFPIIEHALWSRKRVVLPRVNKKLRSLELYYINSVSELINGCWGILEPDPQRCQRAEPEDIDLMFVPGVAFDMECARIGYGGGYYDRLISSFEEPPLLVSVAYEEQIVNPIPVEEHDRRVDVIITDIRTIQCQRDG